MSQRRTGPVVILASLARSTGNRTTALRIAAHYAARPGSAASASVLVIDDATNASAQLAAFAAGTPVSVVVVDEALGAAVVNPLLQRWEGADGAELVVALHAYRAGRLLLPWLAASTQHEADGAEVEHSSLPYVVVFGGTDVNEYVKDEQALRLMTRVVRAARALVSFHRGVELAATKCWPSEMAAKNVRIGPAIPPPRLDTTRPRSWLRDTLGLAPRDVIAILPCGIRPVKDPLFTAAAFQRLHQKYAGFKVVLVVIGPVLDAAFNAAFAQELAALGGAVRFHEAVPQEQLYAAVSDSRVLINSSKSEGLSNALIESMMLECPVLARNIPGNAFFVTHNETGLLYDDLEQFEHLMHRLITDDEFVQRLKRQALEFVQREHSLEQEQRAYLSLLLPK